MLKWNLRISVLLARRGAEVARSRAAAIAGRQAAQRLRRNADWDDGPLASAAPVFSIILTNTTVGGGNWVLGGGNWVLFS